MSKIKGLFQKAWTVVTNPGQDERVQVVLQAIQNGFREHKQAFNLDKVLQPVECTFKDVEVAARQYYETFLGKYWTNGIPDDKQLAMIAWVAGRLELKADEVATMNLRVAEIAFGARLAQALADGIVSDEELAELSRIASFAKMPLPTFVKRGWSDQSLGMLRSLFVEATENGHLSPSLWSNLLQSAHKLGIGRADVIQTVRPMGQSFAEHVLTDAKSDGHISSDEERYLAWLLANLELSLDFQLYVHGEIERVKAKEQLLQGHVPSLRVPPHVNLNAGELLHFVNPATLVLVKTKRSGELDRQFFEGVLYLTDHRIVFESPVKPVSFPYKSLITYSATDKYYRLQVKNKPELAFSFPAPVDHASLLLNVLVKLHSQQLTKKVDGNPSRHIPREVRQRVWQIYGGKCAECSSSDYLEYDHIIPHAKGGSNDERNVQLLCRRCNLAKSDKI